jgi:signal transduction histidine kinase
VINGIPNSLIFVKGQDRKYLLANDTFSELVGGNVIGRTDVDFWPNDAAEYTKNDDEAIANGSQINKLEPITMHGQRRWLNSSKVVLSIDGKPAVLGVCIDVSELVEAKDKIEQLYRSLRHDIVSNTKGVLDMLQLLEISGFEPAEEYREIFELINLKASLAFQLVSNTGKLGEALKVEAIGIWEIFGMVRTMFAVENIVIEKPAENVKIEVDKNVFVLKVLGNLITNAIKYSPKDSEVVIGVKDKGDRLVVFVKDRGPGLTDTEIHTILNNYGSSARLQPEIEGSGTGLNTVQQLLRQQSLELKVRSKKGSGSLFYMEIPKASTNDY